MELIDKDCRIARDMRSFKAALAPKIAAVAPCIARPPEESEALGLYQDKSGFISVREFLTAMQNERTIARSCVGLKLP